MLELFETIAGAITIACYLAPAVVLRSGVIFLFVGLIGTLVRFVEPACVDTALRRRYAEGWVWYNVAR